MSLPKRTNWPFNSPPSGSGEYVSKGFIDFEKDKRQDRQKDMNKWKWKTNSTIIYK